MVIEGVPLELSRCITEELSIPTIGIGAGPHCDGQVLVCYDFLGMVRGFLPKFVKRYAELGDTIVQATQAFVAEVNQGQFPDEVHSFGAKGPRIGNATATLEGAAQPGYGPEGDEP